MDKYYSVKLENCDNSHGGTIDYHIYTDDSHPGINIKIYGDGIEETDVSFRFTLEEAKQLYEAILDVTKRRDENEVKLYGLQNNQDCLSE